MFILLLIQVAIGEVFRPKPPGIGAASAYNGPTASEARPVPVIWGTPLVRGINMLWHGDFLWRDVTEVVKTGLFGTHKQIVAYSYFVGMHLGICMGSIDRFRAIRSGDKVLHQTNLTPNVNFYVRCAEKTGRPFYVPNIMSAAPNDLVAFCTILDGNQSQQVYPYLQNMTDGNLSAYRRMSSLVINGPSCGVMVDLAGYAPLPAPDPVDPPCPPLLPCPAGENERPPLSTYCLSGNVGIDPQIQPYSMIVSRWPKQIPNGNGYVTTGADTVPGNQMHKVCYGASSYQGLRNMYQASTGDMPTPGPSNKGQFYVVNVPSPGLAGIDGNNNPATPSPVHWANTQYGNSTPWYIGDLVISDGKTWYRSVGFDANPAEMIYEVLTGDDDFIGLPAAYIDDASFQIAGKQLYDEGFGLTMQFDQKIKGRDLIGEILRHIDGILFMDVASGKFKLKLIRAGDSATQLIADGKVFNEDNIIELTNFSRSAWDETTNEVKAVWMDAASNFTSKTTAVQDLGNISIQGDVITSTFEYPGITSLYLANRVAYRDLKAISFPMGRLSFRCDRRLYDIGPGDTFVFQWGALGISQIVMRVTSRRESDLLNGNIEIDAVQDLFSMGASAYGDIDPGGWNDPVGGPADITVERLLAAPFFFTKDLSYCEPMALAVKPSVSSFRYNVYQRLSTEPNYQTFDPQPAMVPSGVLLNDYSKSAGLVELTDSAAVDTQPWDLNGASSFVMQSPKDLQFLSAANDSQIGAGYNIALIDEEIVGYNWILMERGLGVHDLVPVGSANGTLTEALLSTAPVNEQWTITATSSSSFSVVGSVSGAQASAAVGTTYDNGKITFLLTAGTNAFQAGDVFRIDVNTARSGTYWFYSVWRGLLDTVPTDHSVGARAYFIGGGLGTCPTQFSPTDAIKVKMTARTVNAESRVSSATELSLTFDSESLRPYPPGNAQVNSMTWPTEITGQPTETWAERNRLTETTIIKQDAATVTPEAGTTYTMLIYRLSNEATSAPFLAGTGATSGPVLRGAAVTGYTLVRTFTGLTAGTVSQAYTVAQELSDMGIAGGTRLSSHIKTILYATANGLSSRQQQVRDFDCAGADMLNDFYYDQ